MRMKTLIESGYFPDAQIAFSYIRYLLNVSELKELLKVVDFAKRYGPLLKIAIKKRIEYLSQPFASPSM